jgi:hypothetical protein
MENFSPWVFSYGFKVYEIPDRMREGIELYINCGVLPGSFLQAVIKNDLKQAVMYADDENMANLPAYANYFYNHAPHDCWGSENLMESWVREKKLEQKKRGGG